MAEKFDSVEAVLYDGSDPRVTGEYVRYHPATDGLGYVVLVGVVHDHPASIYRTGHLVETLQPDTVAVELPRAALPLFESFRPDEAESAFVGGEMSLALRRATGSKVGIDAPSRRYVRRVFGYLSREGVPPIVYWWVAKDLAVSTAQAAWTVLAAAIGSLTGVRFRAHTPVVHEVDSAASPSEQARAESDHIATRKAFLQAIEVPETIRIIDTIREQVMAERIRELREQGDVIAVVGLEHLDPLVEAL